MADRSEGQDIFQAPEHIFQGFFAWIMDRSFL